MDSLLALVVFVLPGFLAYFWIQSFGVNAVVKHTPSEFGVFSALLWLPVAALSLVIFNLGVKLGIIDAYNVWTLDDLKKISGDMDFLLVFFALSIIVSFVFSFIWAKYLHTATGWLINQVRRSRRLAELSPSPTVWEEFFIRVNDVGAQNLQRSTTKQKVMLLMVSKIDKPDEFEIGYMTNASRPYESEKGLVLSETEHMKKSLDHYDYKVLRIYFDLKAGLMIKELDFNNPTPKSQP